MLIDLGRDICGQLESAEAREWIVTNGTGSYASGTVAGLHTRSYHGLLIAALKPPVARTLLLSKLDETVAYAGRAEPLCTNRWVGGAVEPQGYRTIERFYLDGSVPVWRFACADALIEKRIWMQPGADTTYVHYTVLRASGPLTLSARALVNYRDHHDRTTADGPPMAIERTPGGVRVTARPGATPFVILADRGEVSIVNQWCPGLDLAIERERGLETTEHVLHAATFEATLAPGDTLTFAASLEDAPSLDARAALAARQAHERQVLASWQAADPASAAAPDWVRQLVLATDQFIVDRALPHDPRGKTVIAGYHWFTDWGRDTMISLPGLALATGRPEIARSILRTFAAAVSRGMLPNRFPDDGAEAEYNTVDATLWFFQATRQYVEATQDEALLRELLPTLAEIVAEHRRGTRYGIQLDPADGLLRAGQPGVQLTWMDAKVGDWVVTPRIGKPVEVNALWLNALGAMAGFARRLGQPADAYEALAAQARASFGRFWNPARGYCYDLLDGPDGDDGSLRPNQIFAVSLPDSPLAPEQQRAVVDACERHLLVPCALRSLAPDDPQYQGFYGGPQLERDGAYHQGTAWGWLLGPFVLAHLRVYGDPARASAFLEPVARHLAEAGVGSISEIFDGDAPYAPRGCIAQAWSVAEVLRAWAAGVRGEG